MASHNLFIASYSLNNRMVWNTIIENMLSNIDDVSSLFIYEQSDNYISGSFVFQTKVKRPKYNFINNSFEMLSVDKINVVRFDILLEKNKILLWGSKKAIPVFVTFLSISTDNSITIEYNSINFAKAIKKLIKDDHIDFTKMTLNSIVIDKGIIANCNVSLTGLNNSKELVDKYITNISQLTVLVNDESDCFLMRLYNNGTISFFQDRESLSYDIISRTIEIIGGI